MNIFRRISAYLSAKPVTLRPEPSGPSAPPLPTKPVSAKIRTASTGPTSRDHARWDARTKKSSSAAADALKSPRSIKAGRGDADGSTSEAASARIKASDAYINEETIFQLDGGGWGNIRGRLGSDPNDRRPTPMRDKARFAAGAPSLPVKQPVRSSLATDGGREPAKSSHGPDIDKTIRAAVDPAARKFTSAPYRPARQQSGPGGLPARDTRRIPEKAQSRQKAADDYILEETIRPLEGGGWGNIRGRLSEDPLAKRDVIGTLSKQPPPVAENDTPATNAPPIARNQKHRLKKMVVRLETIQEEAKMTGLAAQSGIET